MTVRTPKPDSAARILMRALSELGLSIKYTQAQELLAKVQGFQNAHASRAHAKKSKTAQPPAITCPVIHVGAPPLTAEVLKHLEDKDDIRAIIEFDQNELFELDLDRYLDLVSARMTGSPCGITDISYETVSLPETARGVIAFEITAGEIEWETLDRKPGKAPSRRLAAIEFVPGQFNEVLEVDFNEDLFKWLEGERSASEKDGDLEVIQYEYDGTSRVNYLTLQDLVNATIATDGKLTLEDGTELYLIDQNRERWTPRALEDRVNQKMQELSSSLKEMAPKGKDLMRTADLVGSEDVYPGESADREKYLAQIHASQKAMAPKSTDLSGINYFVHSFRAHASALTARTLRKVADEYLEEDLITRADYETYFKETESTIAEWRQTSDGQPNPALPFYGCELPKQITFIEEVSRRAAEWSKKRQVHFVDDGMLGWLESGLEDEGRGYELSYDVIEYKAELSDCSLSALELIEARLDKDGRFELRDGREFYLIDGAGQRWFPKDRVR